MKKITIVLVIIIVIAIYYWQHEEINSQIMNNIVRTRGYSNNNPGNIRPDGKIWLGEISPSTDPAFKQFKSMDWGYRALFVNLRGYMKAGFNTIRKIISRWAPPTDNNDTGAYIVAVSKSTGYDPDKVLDLTNEKVLKEIAKAISKHENGVDAIPSEVDAGWSLFLTS